MKDSESLIKKTDVNLLKLKEKIVSLKKEINQIEQDLFPFEQSLRNAIADLLVEERELTILYKIQKKAKKEKRLAQKKKDKNDVATTGLKIVKKRALLSEDSNQKEKKRLYKEAMLYVHPDKFSLKENEQELATDITTKLIEIYKTGTLEELQAYHAHIFNGNTSITLNNVSIKSNVIDNNAYLKNQIIALERQLESLLSSHTYTVLTSYEKPMLFVNELVAYYDDRIFKLKKRTRTKK
ncbi:hypothetical protein CXF68_00235 [Tenacibaculum sp. Bg11-29]|uniref:hypothetical protein n=1 Tax=Tenacibaculum sp. Bg11-29 TaxID=2058306 RepID=UPI000C341DA9|nr:hypothetical protein [Tenacibaculum sp. Bg11-29]PKH49208.1 hypothetical protein CXF68_00235 [Tenacibaculum sp. Bg11-29]